MCVVNEAAKQMLPICKRSMRNFVSARVCHRCIINLTNKSLSLAEDAPAGFSLVERTLEITDVNADSKSLFKEF